MKTAREYRAEAERLRALAKDVTDPEALKEIRDVIEELETPARELESGA